MKSTRRHFLRTAGIASGLIFVPSRLARAQVGIIDTPIARAPSSSSAPTPDLLWLKLNGNTTDSSAAGDNGTATGSPTYTTGQDSIANHAISLNGSTQYVSIAATASMSTFTIMCWFKASALDGFQSGLIGTGSTGLGVYSNVGDQVHYSDNFGDYFYNAGFSVGTWYHVAMVANALAGQFYVNGAAVGSGFTLHSAQSFSLIGHEESYYWNGVLDDVRIYSAALSSAQILAIYNANAS